MDCASSFVDMNDDEDEEVVFGEDVNLFGQAPSLFGGLPQQPSLPPQPQQQQQGGYPQYPPPPQPQQGFSFGSSSSNDAPPQFGYYNPPQSSTPSVSSFSYPIPQSTPQPFPYPVPQMPQIPQQQEHRAQQRVKRVRRANTNVVSVKLGTLTEDAVVATGDPLFCDSCGAAFSHLDWKKEGTEEEEGEKGKELKDTMESSKTWACKFCDHPNELNLEEEELPGAESLDYILQPPTEREDSKNNQSSKMIIFCIDISGSMCVSTEIAGKHDLKGSESLKRLATLNTDRADQWAPRERRDVTYVSRLQSVKAAVDAQLQQMEREQPNRKVGLVTFNNDVVIVGDGTTNSETVTGDKLQNFEQLLNIGKAHAIQNSVKETRNALSAKLFALEETGPTALGPALVVAAGIAGEIPGSEIVLCTDGLSNVGLGRLDDLVTEEDRRGMEEFYRTVGEYAVSRGTTISVISIKGEDCSLENLGVLTELTNGAVNIVDPLNITQEFSSILSLPVIATHVSVKLVMHNGLFIRNEQEQVAEKHSFVSREVGNVTSESAFTFEYGVKSAEEVKNKQLSALPFQLQIRYTKLDGMKCIRVITREQKVTWDRAEAEAEVNVDVLGRNAMQQTARMAQDGAYGYSRLNNFAHVNLMHRVAKTNQQQQSYAMWAAKGADFEENMRQEQEQELNEGLALDSEDFDRRDRDRSNDRDRDRERDRDRKERRQNRRGDGVSNMLWNMKSKRK